MTGALCTYLFARLCRALELFCAGETDLLWTPRLDPRLCCDSQPVGYSQRAQHGETCAGFSIQRMSA